MKFTNLFKGLLDLNDDKTFVLDREPLLKLAETHHATYHTESPFPHTVIDSFLPTKIANTALKHFPPPDASLWLDWKQRDTIHQPKKLGVGSAQRLSYASPTLQHILFTLNSYAMLEFLETLTGIEGLISDPHFTGGGLHQILPGGKLEIHSDFNFDQKLKLYRRINVLIFLNKNWQEDYGGHLELWESTMTRCVKRILPVFNRCVIFNTDANSCHGHPEPLKTPPHITRKSIALYYYSRDPKPGDDNVRTTDWRTRPTNTT